MIPNTTLSKPTISIVVPVYNAAKSLNRCLSSLVRQRGNIQIILVDDGSTDDSFRKCEQWANRDTRIDVLSQDNAGVSSARNLGLEHCAGEWVCFVDSDDYIESDTCERLLSLADKSQADMVMFSHVSGDALIPDEPFVSETVDRDTALRLTLSANGYKGYVWNRMYRATVINAEPRIRFLRDVDYCEDLLFNVSFLMRASTVTTTNRPFYHYCDNAESVVHSISAKNETFPKAMDKVMMLLPESLKPLAGGGYAVMAMELLFWSYEQHDRSRIARYRHMVNTFWPDYRRTQSEQSLKTRLRMMGAHYCPSLFCPLWNVLKTIR